MQVVNLVEWAGNGFVYVPGDTIELPPEIAEARVAAGLAERVEQAPRRPRNPRNP